MSMSAATEQIMFNEMMMVRKSMKHSPHESNYTRLFGTPERAARTLAMFSPLACSYCALYSTCGDDQDKVCLLCDYDALLEWLRGDAE
jgi:hypothetical protein